MARQKTLRTRTASSTRETVRGGDEALYRSLVESVHDYALFALSPAGTILTWDIGAQNTLGYTKADVIDKSFALIFTPEDAAAGVPQRELDGPGRGKTVSSERWYVRKDGTRFWAKTVVTPAYGPRDAPVGFAKSIVDLTQREAGPAPPPRTEQQLRFLAERAPDAGIFYLAPDGTIVGWSETAQRIFGFHKREILGRHFAQLFVSEDIANDVPSLLLHKATALDAVQEERWFVRKDGSRFLGTETFNRLRSGSGGGSRAVVHVARDFGERYERSEDLRRRASIDELTQLPNRSVFFENVHRAIAAFKRRPANLFAILFVDLDHFKQINDTVGHIAADRFLNLTARRLETSVRAEDIVARLGGDEFAILCNGIVGISDANDVAGRISASMQHPVTIEGRAVKATVSIGIAMGHQRYSQPEDILRDADAAMYTAKNEGRGRSVIFTIETPIGE